jgi:hypothetical protein
MFISSVHAMISLILVQLREESYWLTGAYKLTCWCCPISTPSETVVLHQYSVQTAMLVSVTARRRWTESVQINCRGRWIFTA